MNGARIARRAALLGALGLLSGAAPEWIATLALYPWLGIVPGLALVETLLPGARGFARVCLALAVAPLASAAAGLALHAAGLPLATAAACTAVAAGLVWLARGAIADRPAPPDEASLPRAVIALALGLAVALALPPLLNGYIAVRGDTWTHGAIVTEILERGLPPEDPRFAGIPLNYAWFYNLFIALLCAQRGHGPFLFMAWMNAATGVATTGLVALVALRLWDRPAAATGAAALVVFGFNAGAFLLWPLALLRGLTGAVRGASEVMVQLRAIEPLSARIIYSLGAPFAHMVSFLDKLLVGSPLATGYLLMTLHAWAIVTWLNGGSPVLLPWIAAATAGMFLFHGVVGLSVTPVWIAALALALVIRPRVHWLPAAGRLAAAAAATAAGALLAAPYLLSVASGWTAERSGVRHSFIGLDPRMPWTLLTACGLALWFARRPAFEAWRERRGTHAVLLLYAACMLLFALVVRLPMDNQVKFVYEVFVPVLILAAPAFHGWLRGLASRGAWAIGLAGLVLVMPAALTLHGYLRDPGPPGEPTLRERPGEASLDRWIRERTPERAVIVDHRFRWDLSVKGRRQLFLGTDQPPSYAGWPSATLYARRRVMADLYGPVTDLPGDLAVLGELRRPVYLVFRPEDDAETARAWSLLSAHPDRFELVHHDAGYRVLRLIPENG